MKKSKQKSRRYKRYIRKQSKKIHDKKRKICLKLIPNIDFPQNIHNIDFSQKIHNMEILIEPSFQKVNSSTGIKNPSIKYSVIGS